MAGGAFILGTLGSDLTVSQAPRTLYVSKIRELVGSRHKDWFLKMGLAGAGLEELALSRAAEPDTPGSPEGNTEGPGTASSEPLLPS